MATSLRVRAKRERALRSVRYWFIGQRRRIFYMVRYPHVYLWLFRLRVHRFCGLEDPPWPKWANHPDKTFEA